MLSAKRLASIPKTPKVLQVTNPSWPISDHGFCGDSKHGHKFSRNWCKIEPLHTRGKRFLYQTTVDFAMCCLFISMYIYIYWFIIFYSQATYVSVRTACSGYVNLLDWFDCADCLRASCDMTRPGFDTACMVNPHWRLSATPGNSCHKVSLSILGQQLCSLMLFGSCTQTPMSNMNRILIRSFYASFLEVWDSVSVVCWQGSRGSTGEVFVDRYLPWQQRGVWKYTAAGKQQESTQESRGYKYYNVYDYGTCRKPRQVSSICQCVSGRRKDSSAPRGVPVETVPDGVEACPEGNACDTSEARHATDNGHASNTPLDQMISDDIRCVQVMRDSSLKYKDTWHQPSLLLPAQQTCLH